MTMMEPDATVPRKVKQAGDYDLIRKMGSGGFGVVFEARHRKTGLMYAVKRIDLSAEDAKRYENEALYPARIASQSLHVLGVHYYFHDSAEDAFYLVTELVPHGDLRKFLDTQPKQLPVALAIDVAIGIAKGLAAIHAQGIIHRDLKPANVLMDRKDDRWVPKISDFGLARSERSVSIGEFATSGYAAPEQMDLLSDQPLGPESDLFAFGMLFYELLTGEKATPTQDLREYGRWIGARKLPPPPSSVRHELVAWPQLDSLAASLLQFDRTKRIGGAAEIVKTLNQVLRSVEGGAQIAKPEPEPKPAPEPTPPRTLRPKPEQKSTRTEPPPEVSEPETGTWTRRRTLLVMAGVFTITGAAMSFGLPWVRGKSPLIPEPLWKFAGAPGYAVASWFVLPALFGLAIAFALRLNAVRVSLLTIIAYNLAASLPDGFGIVGRWMGWENVSNFELAGVVAAGTVGALAVLSTVAPWHRPTRRTVVVTAIAGTVGGAAFLGITLFTGLLPLAFAVWQILVGLVIVDKAVFAQTKRFSTSMKPIAGVVAMTIALCAVSAWVRSWPVPLKAGENAENPKDKARYVWIPPGEYKMGCSADDNECGADEQPAHQVTFTKGFWLGATEVTVKLWKAVVGHDKLPPPAAWAGLIYNPKWVNDDMPIVNVTWQEARDYCRAVDGRLPTEAEWEYAARAGTTGARYGRIREVARYSETSSPNALSTGQMSDDQLREALVANLNTMQNVGGMSTSPWGLEDMLGNASEWVEDDYGEDTYSLASGGLTDPSPHRTGVARAPKALRGGSWANRPQEIRASNRMIQPADTRTVFVGFRCVWDGPANRK